MFIKLVLKLCPAGVSMSSPNLRFREDMLQRFLNLCPAAQFKNCAEEIFIVYKTV